MDVKQTKTNKQNKTKSKKKMALRLQTDIHSAWINRIAIL